MSVRRVVGERHTCDLSLALFCGAILSVCDEEEEERGKERQGTHF